MSIGPRPAFPRHVAERHLDLHANALLRPDEALAERPRGWAITLWPFAISTRMLPSGSISTTRRSSAITRDLLLRLRLLVISVFTRDKQLGGTPEPRPARRGHAGKGRCPASTTASLARGQLARGRLGPGDPRRLTTRSTAFIPGRLQPPAGGRSSGHGRRPSAPGAPSSSSSAC